MFDQSTTFPLKLDLLLRLRNRHFVLLDALILCITPALALMLRVDGVQALGNYAPALLIYIATALLIRVAIFYGFGLYSRYWRYASIGELAQITAAALVSTVAIVILFFMVRIPTLGICDALEPACGLPRSIPFIDAMLVVLAVGFSRFSVRTADLYLQRSRSGQLTQRVLIMGAGEAGAMIARELHVNPQLGIDPIGFVDDDPDKRGIRIRGLPVLGNRSMLPDLAAQHNIDQVIIAMPTASGKAIREVLAICEEAGVPAKTIPGIYELLGGQVSVSQLRNVDIEDLLRREPVQTDIAAVQELLQGRRVLITGGGGSIGSELCRQILRCRPARLVIVGHGENSVFEIQQELRLAAMSAGQRARRPRRADLTQAMPPAIVPVIADVRFAERLHQVFQEHQPQVVFHAAAHKHVPLMEENPGEAITNNVLGTRNLLDAALVSGVERFVLISTDKAVNPTSIMGASKRVAELLVHQAAEQSGRPYVAVRFGNVLGSRGSVVLTFKRQIAAGGPVTVTDPRITRFFMTIPEAVQLVLQAAVLGQGGETFVLDMGDPVKIVDLARDLIHLSGLEVDEDVPIIFTGLRPGEKLYEELFIPGETYHRTTHAKIFVAGNGHPAAPDQLDTIVEALATSAQHNDRAGIVRDLCSLIPEFTPDPPEAALYGNPQLTASEALELQQPLLSAAGVSNGSEDLGSRWSRQPGNPRPTTIQARVVDSTSPSTVPSTLPSTTASYDTAVRNMLLYGELMRALRALLGAGIPVIVLKGAALADTIYPSIASRPMSDIDLLIRRAERERAVAALEAAGFHSWRFERPRFSPFDIQMTNEIPLRRGERHMVELHWEIAPIVPLRLAALDNEALWQEARPFAIGGVSALQLSTRDTLLHICLHLAGHGYLHDNGFQDIRRLLQAENPFPWEQFVQRAQQFRLTAVCYFALDALTETPDVAIPSQVLATLRRPAWQRRLVRLIADPRRGLAGQLTVSRVRNYLLYLALADRLWDIPRVVAWLLFPGPRWLAERYQLSGRLQPYLACLWHPGVILAQGTAALWTAARR